MSVGIPPFQSFLDEHQENVYRFLVSLVGFQEAEDCFQETMLAALRAYPRLRPDSNLRGWVLTIAHRKALDHQRTRGRRAVPVAEVADSKVESDAGGAGEVWTQVRDLPSKQRTAIVLRFAGDLPHDDIGHILGCSEDAARRNVHEGLKKLREVWTQ